MSKTVKTLTASEAVYGFCAWLTTRKERTTMSSEDNAAPVCDLIQMFCEENDLPDPRENYAEYLRMPTDDND